MGMRSNSSSQQYSAWRNSSKLYSPRSLMPSCLRTVLAPPSQPTIYDAPIAPVRFAYFTCAVTPDSSWVNDSSWQPYRTVTEGSPSAIDFSSGSSVDCEMRWYGSRGMLPSLQARISVRALSTDG